MFLHKLLIVILIIFAPSVVLADEWKIVAQSRIEHRDVYSKEEKKYVQEELTFRLESNVSNNFKSKIWIVPRIRFGFGTWKMGPELRMPTFGTDKWKLLLQAEFNIDNWRKKRESEKYK